jgi:hypothetical protein
VSKIFFPVLGALIGAFVDIILHLIAASLEKQPFFEQVINTQGILTLVGLAILGLIIAVWIERISSHSTSQGSDGITVKGLKSVRSTFELKGKKINVSDTESTDSQHKYENP